MTSRLLLTLAGYRPAHAAAIATAAERAEAEAQQYQLSEDGPFSAAMEARRKASHVVLGEDQGGSPYIIAVDDLTGAHGWVSAATGAGKSRIAGNLVDQMLSKVVTGAPVAVIVFDCKGELGDLVLRAAANTASQLPEKRRAAFLGKLRILRPFAGDYLVPLQLLRRDHAVPAMTQAHAFAEVLEQASEAPLGVRQDRALTFLCALGIEAGVTLPELRWRLSYDRKSLGDLAKRCTAPEVRLYFHQVFSTEEATSLEGIAARMDALLRVDALRAALSAEEMFRFNECCTPGLTVVDLGNPPMGAEGAARALAALLLARMTWSAFAAERRPETRIVVVADELQQAITGAGSNAHHLDRILTTGRSAGIALWSFHQGTSQLPKEFAAALGQNVRFRLIGRSSSADAAASQEWLPVTGAMPRPRPPGAPPEPHARYATRTEELARRVADLGRLPPRRFLVGDRLANFRPRFVTAAAWNPPPWDRLPPDVSEAARRGTAGVPRAVLVGQAVQREEALAAELLAEGRTPSPRGRKRAATPDLPDIVGMVGRQAGRRPGGQP